MITKYLRLDHSSGEEYASTVSEDDMDSVDIEIWYVRLHTMLSTRKAMMIDDRKVKATIWRECDLRVMIDHHCFDVCSRKYVFTDTDNSHDHNLQRMEHDIVLTYMNNRDKLIEAYDY